MEIICGIYLGIEKHYNKITFQGNFSKYAYPRLKLRIFLSTPSPYAIISVMITPLFLGGSGCGWENRSWVLTVDSEAVGRSSPEVCVPCVVVCVSILKILVFMTEVLFLGAPQMTQGCCCKLHFIMHSASRYHDEPYYHTIICAILSM